MVRFAAGRTGVRASSRVSRLGEEEDKRLAAALGAAFGAATIVHGGSEALAFWWHPGFPARASTLFYFADRQNIILNFVKS